MKGGDNVAKKTVKPYHSPKGKVHHTNPKCTEGNNIERGNKRPGKGGKRKCKNC